MLSHERLVELYRELQGEKVLSVYLDTDEHDPASRHKWRVRLDQAVAQTRKQLGATPEEECQAFDRALQRVEEQLKPFDAFIPARGWVAFATADRLWYADAVSVQMPDLVRWEKGLRAAPYVRGLKQERPVIVGLLDSIRARVFRYQDGEIEEVQDLRADTFLGDMSDVGFGKRPATTTGVRGETSTDASQRIVETGSERLLKEFLKVVGDLCADGALLVLGGVTERATVAAKAVPPQLAKRMLEVPSLHLGMTATEVRDAAGQAASQITQRNQDALLDEVTNQAKAGGKACLGREETEQALREMRVDTLLLSRNFLQDNADYADRCLGTAFAQGAAVEELTGQGATQLDAEGGIAARLRFVYRRAEQESDSGAPEAESPPAPNGRKPESRTRREKVGRS